MNSIYDLYKDNKWRKIADKIKLDKSLYLRNNLLLFYYDNNDNNYEGLLINILSAAKQGLPFVVIDSNATKEGSQYIKTTCQNFPAATLKDAFAVFFTSGSTGKPRPIIWTKEMMIRHVKNRMKMLGVDKKTRLASMIPLSMKWGVLNFLVAGFSGASFEYYATNQGYNGLIKKIINKQIDFLVGNPYQWTGLLSYLEKSNLRTNIVAHIGSAIISKDLVVRLSKRVKKIINLYGSTEAFGVICNDPIGLKKPESVGKPEPGNQVAILDGSGKECGSGKIGEIVLRGLDISISCPTPYFTGDLGYKDKDGDLFVVGRKDDILKVNGYQISCHDYEKHYNKYRSFVLGINRDDGWSDVAIIFETEEPLKRVKEYIDRMIPPINLYCRPKWIFAMKKLPLTSTKKIDKQKIKTFIERKIKKIELNLNKKETRSYSGNKGTVLYKIIEIWQEIFKNKAVDANSDFFSLGGSSIDAMQIISQIKHRLKIDISIDAILKNPALKKLAKVVRKSRKINGPISIMPAKPKPFYALSHAQKRMWVLYNLEPNSAFYNVLRVLKLTKKLNVPVLRQSIQAVINRHEALRTNFDEINGRLVQIIHQNKKNNLVIIDLKNSRNKSKQKKKNEVIQSIIKQEAGKPFKLEKDQLIRFTLIKTDADENILILAMHHIIIDNWSINALFSELNQLYKSGLTGKQADLPALAIQYKDYSEWERARENTKELKKQEKYWLKKLAGELPISELPLDNPRPAVQTYNGSIEEIVLDHNMTRKLKQLANKNNVTLFMLLFAAFNAFLYKLTGQEDLIVGVIAANREYPELENVVGPLLNTLAIRTKITNTDNFANLLKYTKQNILDGFANKDYSFDRLIEKLNPPRDLSRLPIVNIIFHMLDYEQGNKAEQQASNKLLSSYQMYDYKTTQFDARFIAIEQPGKLVFRFNYNTDLYHSRTARLFLKLYRTLLENVLAESETEIARLELLTKKEKKQLIYNYNNTKAVYPKEKTVHQLFEEQAKRTPDSVAVISGEQEITYRELNQKANQLADFLITRYKIKTEDKIAIITDRSIDMVVAILAAIKSGAAYVPINQNYPLKRIKYMIRDAKSPLILTQEKIAEEKLKWFKGNIFRLDSDWTKIDNNKSANQQTKIKPNNLIYVIYTSGSTGNPKGVMVEHQEVTNICYAINKKIKFHQSDRILALANINFDISIFELLFPLVRGMSLVLASEEDIRQPVLLGRLITKKRINIVQFTPSMAELMVGHSIDSKVNPFKHLDKVLITGEAFYLDLFFRIKKLTKASIYNLYGPTEATIWSTFYKAKESKERIVSIGKPLANTQIYVLDQGKQLVPPGLPGELYVSGDGLARGYLNQPEMTKKVFLPHPFIKGQRIYKTGDMVKINPDGNIDYISRIDYQIKIRGNRVELGEIEANLNKLPQIEQAVVVAKEEKNKASQAINGYYLVAYYTAKTKVAAEEIRGYLKNILPDYMIPSFFVELPKFPLNANGKLDRSVLPELDKNQLAKKNKYQPPITDLEKKLVAIWQEVLGIKKIGINDSFFELGGNSLKLLMVNAKIKGILKIIISPIKLFEFNTILSLVNFLFYQNKKLYDTRKNKISLGKGMMIEMLNKRHEI
ncbi:MAG TPA: amino acid adenylation domain-containing protein [Candidatus Portnoybacteria bacterium]|nr:amino acid adenylation domain-containing protein [Candidatus Portnoybacteria bacterium]